MKSQIDQSVKIEQTENDTILAFSNDVKYAVRLKAKAKRMLQLRFRSSNKPEVFMYFVFAALLGVLLINVCPKQKVIIDHEYLGHEDIIKLKLTQILQKQKVIVDFDFGFVGKKSPAHELAARVATGKIKVNKIVTEKEILKYVLIKEKDRVSHSGPRIA